MREFDNRAEVFVAFIGFIFAMDRLQRALSKV
jgi:hypothetical protein